MRRNLQAQKEGRCDHGSSVSSAATTSTQLTSTETHFQGRIDSATEKTGALSTAKSGLLSGGNGCAKTTVKEDEEIAASTGVATQKEDDFLMAQALAGTFVKPFGSTGKIAFTIFAITLVFFGLILGFHYSG